MNHFIRALFAALLAAFVLPVWAAGGLLSQKILIQNPNYGSSQPQVDHFGGTGVSISHDGRWFVVAMPNFVPDPEWHDSTGSASAYHYTGAAWTDGGGGYVNGPTTAANYGTGIAISADGKTAAFGDGQSCLYSSVQPGAPRCDMVGLDIRQTVLGSGLGSNGFDDPTWSTLFSTSTFAQAVSLSSDATTIIVGAPTAGSSASVAMASRPGEAFIFTTPDNGATWSTTTLANPSDPVQTGFGAVVAMAANGQTAVVETPAGSAYVYGLSGGSWNLVKTFGNLLPVANNFTDAQYLMGPVEAVEPYINASMAVSADGKTLVFSSNGGVLVETQGPVAGTWSSVTIPGSPLGAVAVSADGTMIAAADPTNNAVDLYDLVGGSWTPRTPISGPSGTPSTTAFGQAGLALSGDKETLVVPDPYATVSGWPQSGAVYVYQSPADLSITGTASPSAVYLNQQTTLSFNVTNNDTAVTTYNVVLTDTLPAGFTNILTTPGVGASCSVSGQTVTCTLPSLEPGATWSPSVAASVTTAGNYTDAVSVSSNQPDPDTTNNSVNIGVSMVPPTANSAAFTVNADVTYNGNLSGNNPCNCGTLAYSVVQQPAHGTVTITDAHTGAFSYTPAAAYLGADSFTFQLTNGFGTSAAAAESVTVKDVPPTATGASVGTNVNQPLNGTLTATPGYAEQKLSYAVVTRPAHGSVTVTASTGAFTYAPATGFIGTDSFTFTAGDGTVTSSPATVTVTVKDIPPVANNGSVTTQANQPVSGTLSATPGYAGQALSFAVMTPPAHGTVTVTAATGAFIYTPALGFVGSDSFAFAAGDGNVNSSAATVNITVQDIAPTANSDNVTTTVNQPATGTLSATPGFTGQLLSYAVVTQPTHGHVTLTASSGAFTYTPDNGYVGSDSFTFAAGDGIALSATATVSITVNDVAPTANAGSVTTNSGQAVSGTLSATAGYSGQALQFAVVAQPSHGTVTVNAAGGAFTYTPTSGYSGSDSFTFTAGDGTLTSAAATESVTVKAAAGGGGGGGGGFGVLGLGLLAGVLGLARRRRRV